MRPTWLSVLPLSFGRRQDFLYERSVSCLDPSHFNQIRGASRSSFGNRCSFVPLISPFRSRSAEISHNLGAEVTLVDNIPKPCSLDATFLAA